MSKKEFLDKWQEKLISRKLLVFIIATALMFTGKLESNDWVYVAISYLTMQGMIDVTEFLQSYKK